MGSDYAWGMKSVANQWIMLEYSVCSDKQELLNEYVTAKLRVSKANIVRVTILSATRIHYLLLNPIY